MTNDNLSSPDTPEVVKVHYLGDSYEEYMAGFTSEQDGITGGGGFVGRANEKEESRSNVGVIAGTVTAMVCLLLLALLFAGRKRMRSQSKDDGDNEDFEQDLDDDLDDLVAGIDGAATSRNFTIDPPGAFHLGNHHYTSDGVRYFSPQCAMCLTAKANGSLDRKEENAHDFDDTLSYDFNAARKFTDFNSNDLGRYHSSMHVRCCKSTTCQGCKDNLEGVVFVTTQKEQREIML